MDKTRRHRYIVICYNKIEMYKYENVSRDLSVCLQGYKKVP